MTPCAARLQVHVQKHHSTSRSLGEPHNTPSPQIHTTRTTPGIQTPLPEHSLALSSSRMSITFCVRLLYAGAGLALVAGVGWHLVRWYWRSIPGVLAARRDVAALCITAVSMAPRLGLGPVISGTHSSRQERDVAWSGADTGVTRAKECFDGLPGNAR